MVVTGKQKHKVFFLFPRFHSRHTPPTQHEKKKVMCPLSPWCLWCPVLLGGISVPWAEPGAATTPWRKYYEQLLFQVRLRISVKEQKVKLCFLGVFITAQQIVESVLPNYFNGNHGRNHRDYGSWKQRQKLYVKCLPGTESLEGVLQKDWLHWTWMKSKEAHFFLPSMLRRGGSQHHLQVPFAPWVLPWSYHGRK